MSWYALDEIEEAFEEARDTLLPFDLKQWSFFAVIVLLTGYTLLPTAALPSSTPSGDYQHLETDTTGGISDVSTPGIQTDLNEVPEVPELSFTALLAMIAGALAFGALYLVVTSIFQFVMYRSVDDGQPRLSLAKEYLREGLEYAGFRALMTLITVIVFVTGIVSIIAYPVAAFLVIPGLLIFYIAISGFRWLVFHYGLPTMVRQERGLVSAIKVSIDLFKNNVGQTLLFWIVKWLLGLAVGLAGLVALLSATLLLLIPFGLLGLILGAVSQVLVAPIALIFFMLVIGAALYLAVPIRVYIYQYILLVFGDIAE